MKIAATPMCQEILRLAGVSEYEIINDDDYDPVDILFTLSETKITLDSSVKYVKLKLNTFPQIIESIKLISEMLGTEPLNKNLNHISTDHHKEENKKMHLKVYTNFLREIVEDMGFQVVEENYDYLVYPDYLKSELEEEIKKAGERAVELPSHGDAPNNPLERAEIRYEILEKIIG